MALGRGHRPARSPRSTSPGSRRSTAAGPALRAVLEINPDALAIADSPRRRAQGAARSRGPLHGDPGPHQGQHRHRRPDEHDRRLARARWARSPPPTRSSSQRLREAGAVILGKTNLSEWANFRSTHSSSGWSGRGGQSRNPVRARPQPVGLELGLRAPRPRRASARVGRRHRDGRLDRVAVEQLRPRRHQADARPRQPRSGIIPIAHSQDTAGPMAPHRDGRRDPARRARRRRRGATRRPGERRQGARRLHEVPRPEGARRARASASRARSSSARARRPTGVAEAALADMKRLGRRIVDPADIATLGEFDDSEFEVLLYEFKADLNAYLARRSARGAVRTLAGPDRVQREEPRPRDALLRPGDSSSRRRSQGTADRQGVPRRAREGPAAVARRRASTRPWTSTSSTRSSRRRAGRRR